MDKRAFLKNLAIFESLPQNEIDRLSKLFVEENYGKGEYIFYERDSCCYLYVVYHGRIRIIKHSPSGKDTIIGIIPPGEIFGVVPLLSGAPFPASAVASEPSAILKLPKNRFIDLEKKFSGFSISIVETIGRRLATAYEVMQSMAAERIEIRIARALLKLFKDQSNNGKSPISVTRQELADMVGTTIETSIRTLSKFKRDGIITSSRGKIWIKDISALER